MHNSGAQPQGAANVWRRGPDIYLGAPELEKQTLLGLPVTTGASVPSLLSACHHHLENDVDHALTVTFINPHAWAIAQRHARYQELLEESDIVLMDGIGVVRAAERFLDVQAERISFDYSSLAGPVFRTCAQYSWSVALVGGKPGVAAASARHLQTLEPSLRVVLAVDGYREFAELVRLVKQKGPDVVVVGMGAPRQEEFMQALAEAGVRSVIMTCGGFLDQSAECQFYYPDWIDRWNLRFLYRLYREPLRLGRRYAVEYLPFIRHYLAARLQGLWR